jgi:hypothetical protein
MPTIINATFVRLNSLKEPKRETRVVGMSIDVETFDEVDVLMVRQHPDALPPSEGWALKKFRRPGEE